MRLVQTYEAKKFIIFFQQSGGKQAPVTMQGGSFWYCVCEAKWRNKEIRWRKGAARLTSVDWGQTAGIPRTGILLLTHQVTLPRFFSRSYIVMTQRTMLLHAFFRCCIENKKVTWSVTSGRYVVKLGKNRISEKLPPAQTASQILISCHGFGGFMCDHLTSHNKTNWRTT